MCHGKTSGEWQREQMLTSLRKSRVAAENISSKLPSSMGVPINMLHSLDSKQNSSEHSNSSSLTLLFCPRPQDNLLGVNLEHTKEASNSCWGSLTIPSYDILIRIAKSQKPIKTTEILCGKSKESGSFNRLFFNQAILFSLFTYPLFILFRNPDRRHLPRAEREAKQNRFSIFLMYSGLCSSHTS